LRHSQRCWHDENDDIPEHYESADTDPLLRPLKRGEVGVSFSWDHSAREIEIVPESSLELIDRTFQPGDYCKKRINDVRAGVITNVSVKGLFEHVITGERVSGWHTADELEPRREPEGGDYVVYDNWIGQVCY
jgi:ubiquitin-conjugating enzyme E2 O